MDFITVTLINDHPSSFELHGRTWHVTDGVRWFERVPWWETERRMPKGLGKTDVMVWRVQARMGRNPRNALVTFELVCGIDRVRWWVRSMDAVAAWEKFLKVFI